VLPYRSNIPAMADFAFDIIDETYPRRAREAGDHVVVGGENYGQGSSREHAALAPRYLGLRLVVARSFARIHWQNLVNFGILPLRFETAADYDRIEPGDVLRIGGVHAALRRDAPMTAELVGKGERIALRHDLSKRQIDLLLAGGVINWLRAARQTH
jgi:aconitate hydratase